MMKWFDWKVRLGLLLVVLSAVLYAVHYLLFGDAHHIVIYLVGDIAFVPIEVLMVTLILHRLLTVREKRAMLKKLNMVIGAFFSEVGTRLLKDFSNFDPESEQVRSRLHVDQQWTRQQFLTVGRDLRGRAYTVDVSPDRLDELRQFLTGKRGFLLRLLENPNLLEHDAFTDLLWAVFHLTEELAHRGDLTGLPETDTAHLAGDVKRAYGLLMSEWVDYMDHLREDYPYLFSLAIRTNPFDPAAKVEVG